MITYLVFAAGTEHSIKAVTFTQGADLRFIGENGSVVAVFTSFEWLKALPAEPKPETTDTLTTDKPELAGE